MHDGRAPTETAADDGTGLGADDVDPVVVDDEGPRAVGAERELRRGGADVDGGIHPVGNQVDDVQHAAVRDVGGQHVGGAVEAQFQPTDRGAELDAAALAARLDVHDDDPAAHRVR